MPLIVWFISHYIIIHSKLQCIYYIWKGGSHPLPDWMRPYWAPPPPHTPQLQIMFFHCNSASCFVDAILSQSLYIITPSEFLSAQWFDSSLQYVRTRACNGKPHAGWWRRAILTIDFIIVNTAKPLSKLRSPSFYVHVYSITILQPYVSRLLFSWTLRLKR